LVVVDAVRALSPRCIGLAPIQVGVVASAGYNSSMGNYVMINHGGGLYTIYMHASALCCKEGDVVVTGQTIAKVGSTGNSTGNHLHFTVRKDGNYVDPNDYVYFYAR